MFLPYLITRRQNNSSDFNVMTALDRSIFLDMLFSAPHQSMCIYGRNKNDMKTANAAHYTCLYIVFCTILNLVGCMHVLYRKWLMKRQC